MEPKDQGSQQDGNSPEPSQNLEGNNPVPSQDDTGQLTDQDMQNLLPDQDDRGVPVENVLGEMRRKMDKMMEELSTLKSIQHNSYQQPQQFQQPYQQPNMQQQQMQTQQIIPKNADEIADIIDRECREKFEESFNAGTATYWEMEKFRDKRRAELSQLMVNERFKSLQTDNSVASERNTSETRIKGLYPDLNNLQSPLTIGVVNEMRRRAYAMGIQPNDLYAKDPYLLESVAPFIASQMGIAAKAQNNVRIKPQGPNLPPSNFQGRQTQVKEVEKPTDNDLAFAQRFGINPESLVKARNMPKNIDPNDTSFIDRSGKLYS